jgi:hypothetical protein
MREYIFRKGLAIGIIILFLGAGITPIVNANYSIKEQLILNENIKNEDYNSITIQKFENGTIIDEYQVKIDKNKAMKLFEKLVTTDNIIKEIEILESSKIISKSLANSIKDIYYEKDKTMNNNAIQNYNNKKKPGWPPPGWEEFNFTDNSTFISIVRQGPGAYEMFKLPLIISIIIASLIILIIKHPIIGSILFLMPCILLFLTCIAIEIPSVYFQSLFPICVSILTPLQFITEISFGKIKINTKNYNYSFTGITGVGGGLFGFTGIKINSFIFGSLFLGYTNEIEFYGIHMELE